MYIIPSKDPGLGIEIDESVIRKYPYDEKKLHLQVRKQKSKSQILFVLKNFL